MEQPLLLVSDASAGRGSLLRQAHRGASGDVGRAEACVLLQHLAMLPVCRLVGGARPGLRVYLRFLLVVMLAAREAGRLLAEHRGRMASLEL